MAATGAEHVSRCHFFRSVAGLECDAQPGRIILHRDHFSAELDREPEARQMFAQDGFGTPLRQTALEWIGAANAAQVRARQLA